MESVCCLLRWILEHVSNNINLMEAKQLELFIKLVSFRMHTPRKCMRSAISCNWLKEWI